MELAVLVERRGPDEAELAPGQHRLDHLPGVHRPLGRAGTHDRVQLVDEGDDLALGVGDLLEHRLQALLELAAVLGPGHHGAQVERDDALALEPLGHVALDDPVGQPLDDRRLADAGLPDQHRVVLRAPRQHLDHPADLLVAPDDRVELALAGRLGEVAPVLGQGLVGLLGVRRGHAVVAPDGAQRGQQRVLGDADLVGQRQHAGARPRRSRHRGRAGSGRRPRARPRASRDSPGSEPPSALGRRDSCSCTLPASTSGSTPTWVEQRARHRRPAAAAGHRAGGPASAPGGSTRRHAPSPR